MRSRVRGSMPASHRIRRARIAPLRAWPGALTGPRAASSPACPRRAAARRARARRACPSSALPVGVVDQLLGDQLRVREHVALTVVDRGSAASRASPTATALQLRQRRLAGRSRQRVHWPARRRASSAGRSSRGPCARACRRPSGGCVVWNASAQRDDHDPSRSGWPLAAAGVRRVDRRAGLRTRSNGRQLKSQAGGETRRSSTSAPAPRARGSRPRRRSTSYIARARRLSRDHGHPAGTVDERAAGSPCAPSTSRARRARRSPSTPTCAACCGRATSRWSARINALAVRADWVLPGLREGGLLTGASTPRGIAAFYLERGVPRVVVKCGASSARELFTASGERHRLAAFAVETVDTVGAGDGFAAGLISAGLDGLGDAAALERAVAVGAFATTSAGDSDGLHAPTSWRRSSSGRACARTARAFACTLADELARPRRGRRAARGRRTRRASSSPGARSNSRSASSTASTARSRKRRTSREPEDGAGLLEVARGQREAGGEARVGALRAAVGLLDRAEELFLEAVGVALVEQLVGDAVAAASATAELVDRGGDVVEQVLAGLGGRSCVGLPVARLPPLLAVVDVELLAGLDVAQRDERDHARPLLHVLAVGLGGVVVEHPVAEQAGSPRPRPRWSRRRSRRAGRRPRPRAARASGSTRPSRPWRTRAWRTRRARSDRP